MRFLCPKQGCNSQSWVKSLHYILKLGLTEVQKFSFDKSFLWLLILWWRKHLYIYTYKHFPKTSRLHKIFNRSSIRVSYSCMSNIKTSISNHNRRLLEQQIVPPSTGCNCRTLNECPLNGKCLTESLVYQAEITSTDAGEAKTYIGMTGGSFKKRYANDKKSINNPRY